MFALLLLVVGGAALLLLSMDGGFAGLDEGQFAHLVYFGAWGLLMAGGILALFRGRLFGALRDLMVWGLVFVALIGVFAYSHELKGVGDRVLGVLMPGRAIEVAGSGGTQYRVVRSGDDHFHVEGSIDGRPVTFVVDTGASMIALDTVTAERLGIDTAGLNYRADIMTANGVAKAAMVKLDEVRIGGIERRNVQAAITEGRLLGGTVLLGMSFLNTLTSFDFRRDTLVLTD
ncbi:retropepsin-like aspartic protease family protein [Antarcticirhabdus aurantiaca]|uniref:TIGR02281 family clan AA aspartic protease n=1 Tax=Antarcticirhabdus aurantiaca TaxID=2606717 RepID=A0ACD4NUZ5_9HYPH|nr:TIGR02281 family clan AA aspartic protease [Antarcticirhabdus aurantiaca]WAJ30594.1 TIGR02281 family clan AA aspartic protease [Jeongeuplla avenae]